MGKHDKQGKGASAPFNPVLDASKVAEVAGLDAPEQATEVTGEILVPQSTDTFRSLIQEATKHLLKAEGVDYLNASKEISEDNWYKWATETIPEVTNVKTLTIRMEGRLIGRWATQRAMREDQRGGDQSKNKKAPKSGAEKMVDTKLKTIAENPEVFEEYCRNQAALDKQVSIQGAYAKIKADLAKKAGIVKPATESTVARRERLTHEAIAELAARSTSFKTVAEVVAFSQERLTMILLSKDTVSNEEMSNATLRSLGMRKQREEKEAAEKMAANLAAHEAAKAARDAAKAAKAGKAGKAA